jgi:hypothetical protein
MVSVSAKKVKKKCHACVLLMCMCIGGATRLHIDTNVAYMNGRVSSFFLVYVIGTIVGKRPPTFLLTLELAPPPSPTR